MKCALKENIAAAPLLSAEILSDLVLWHHRVAAGGHSDSAPENFRILIARCAAAVADVRLGALGILETATEYLESGRAGEALAVVKAGAKAYRDLPDGRARWW